MAKKPKVYGRKIADYNTRIPVDSIDEITIEYAPDRILTVSLIAAREGEPVIVRAREGLVAIKPIASNTFEVETRGYQKRKR